ncbi:MAG: hemerythrin domain-containing protein [Sphingomonas sp.]|uniref:hemerythrin domain-containing protein n=1 Tax=Sphingomonas sp. TaxID=28214 RepID=UPI0025DBF954|nr:hemerythrin domain-containing protein [Sphingomonas sp.]MBX9880903.1 hemerythrin domain-containing protein [Sphingomonas sp.]
MSVVDKVIGALTPPETEEQRMQAHDKARAACSPGDWLSMALDHHEQIYAAFEAVKQAGSPDEARTAQKQLMALFTGHGTAEETVLYPSLAKDGQKGHATQAYTEQATAKMQFAELERLAPLSQEYMEKLGHIEGAVKHHIYEEESIWFLDMKESAPADLQQLATARFREEYERYMNGAEQGGIGGLGSRALGGGRAAAGSTSSDFGSDLGGRTGGERGSQGSLGGSMAGTGGTGSGLSPDYGRDTTGRGDISGDRPATPQSGSGRDKGGF